MSFKNISVVLSANVLPYKAAMAQAAAATRGFGESAEQVGDKTRTGLGLAKAAAVGAVAGIAALGAGLVLATKEAIEFEGHMRNVNSIVHGTEAELARTSQQVIAMSKELPQSASNLAQGLYDIASSGFQGAEGLQVLKAAGEAASAGLADTATSAQAITAVLNAYGRGAGDATDVSDILFQTVNLGVVSFSQLAGVVGDFVGTAAAAKVPIEDATAALATMTLSGISANEAGTSLNRVLQSLIKPSDEMAASLEHLGYESGAQALAGDGLRVVLERLREATGGNITTLLALFPEIRAARGALALMADEGRQYTEVSEGISDADARHGATKKALAEQAKGLGFQMSLARNELNAMAITVGLRLLPVLKDGLERARELAVAGVGKLREAAQALAPMFEAVVGAGRNVVALLIDLARGSAPVVAALAGLAASGVVAALTTMAGVLEAVTGFLADHSTLVLAAGIAWGLHLLPALVGSVAAFGAMALEKVALGLIGVSYGANSAAAGFSAMGAAVTVATVGGAVLLAGMVSSLASARKEADELAASVTEGLDATNMKSLQEATDRLTDLEQEVLATGKATGGWGNELRAIGESVLPGYNSGVVEARDNVRAYRDELDRIGKLRSNLAANRVAIRNAISPGLASEEWGKIHERISATARTLGVDLTVSGDKGKKAQQDVIVELRRVAAQSGLTATELAKMPESALKALMDLHEAADTFAANVGKSMRDATDVVAGFGSQAAITTGDVATFYKDQVKLSGDFANNVRTAIRQGYDPALIARILEAGPKQAAPLLGAIVGGHSANLVKMVNDSEAKLRELNELTVRMARLTQLAVSSSTDEMARDLPKAMDIVAAQFAAGGKKSAEELAKAVGLGLTDVERIVAEFGITIPVTVTPGRQGAGTGNIRIGTMADGGILSFYAAGGTKERHQAQIARAGDWRVWAEPETGGEAYIPLSPSKRSRSLGILAQVADAFGVGITSYASGGSSRSLPSAPVGGGIGAQVAAAVASEMSKARSAPPIEITQHNDFRDDGSAMAAADYAARQIGWELALMSGTG